MDLEGTACSNGRSSTITNKVSRIIDAVGKKCKEISEDLRNLFEDDDDGDYEDIVEENVNGEH